MSKDFPVFLSRGTWLQRIVDYVGRGQYFYYQKGSCTLAEMDDLVDRFSRLYDLNLTKMQALRRRKKGVATHQLLLLATRVESRYVIAWCLLKTEGEPPNQLAAEIESSTTWSDCRKTKQRLEFFGQELSKLTKKGTAKPVWTWRFTSEKIDYMKKLATSYIKKNRPKQLQELIDASWRTPGFYGNRTQLKSFYASILGQWQRYRSKTEEPPAFPRLGYLRRQRDKTKPLRFFERKEKALQKEGLGSVK